MEELKPRLANSWPLSPIGFLERAAIAYADCPSIIYNAVTYTWATTHQRCLQVASSLCSMGVKRGHVVSVVAPNIPAMYELHFAVPMSGAILNAINTRLDARTISVILTHSESKLVFVDEAFATLVVEAISLLPSNAKPPTLVLIDDHDHDQASPSPIYDLDITYNRMVEMGDRSFKWAHPKSDWDPLVLNYTSGTTASPKGVVNSHRAMYLGAIGTLADWVVPKQAVYLWTLPMFHSNGWSLPWGMAAIGGTNICLRKFNASTIYSLIKKHGVTHMCAAPVVLNMLSNCPEKEVLQNTVHIMTAGAPPPAPVLLRVESLGFVVSHGYGLTEAAGIVVSCAWKSRWNRLPATERAKLKARQGVRTVECSEVDVIDINTGRSVKWDGLSMGEIVLRSACIMLGYLKDSVATSTCMTEDGWLHTGDMAVIHPDGYMEIKDRMKDVIISGGENISSAEVESVLYSNPDVNEAAVVARVDSYWGETPCAFVSLKENVSTQKPTERDVIEFCRERMPHYMAPKKVVFVEELPRTSTGKIQKSVLREMANALT